MDIFLSLTGDGIYWETDYEGESGIVDLDKFFNKSILELEPDIAEIYKHKFNEFTSKLYEIARNNEEEKECWQCSHCYIPNYPNDGMADCKRLDKVVMCCDTCDEWIEEEEEEEEEVFNGG